MALVIEDGSGVADAEAYISVADADAYFTARGGAAWAALDTAGKEQALRRSTDYLEAAYAWRGERATSTQALSWPRACVVVDGFLIASTIVPLAIQRANAELAVRASAGDLAADQAAQVKQETVGPITVVYADGARQGVRYALVDALVAAYVRGGGQIAVVRA